MGLTKFGKPGRFEPYASAWEAEPRQKAVSVEMDMRVLLGAGLAEKLIKYPSRPVLVVRSILKI